MSILILFDHPYPGFVGTVNTLQNATLPVDCQLAIVDDSKRGSDRYRAGNVSALGPAQFKSVFGER
jgi:hypothetical protein